MFRCKDCKAEYEIKPDYCECGNDSFDEFLPDDENLEETMIKKQSFSERYPVLKRLADSFDVVSVSIFTLCIIFSILPWIFWGKGIENKQAHAPIKEKPHSKINKKIPNISTFWDDTAVKVETPSPAIIQQTPIDDIAIQREQMREEIRNREPEKRHAAPASPLPRIRHPQAVDNSRAILEAKIKKEKEYKTALNSYKAGLRQVLFSRLAVGSVQGIGRCEVEFSVDDYGRLIHKRFSKLSDNKSLNDAVYSMLMGVSQYSPPPDGYNGEKIRLNFYFNNGYYEVGY